MPSLLLSATLLLALVALCPSDVIAQQVESPGTTTPRSELDTFMEKVLAQRDVNRQTLRQYILDEAEEFEVLGPGRSPLYRTKREFTWYLRDGVHVRSPLRFDGVKVTDAERDRYEEKWLSRERHRQEERAKKKQEKETSVGPEGVEMVSPGVPAEPRFVSEAYFMDFKFEPGNYYLAGREKLEAKEVLKIEYTRQRCLATTNMTTAPPVTTSVTRVAKTPRTIATTRVETTPRRKSSNRTSNGG